MSQDKRKHPETKIEPFYKYINEIEKNLLRGNFTEHTHRPALKNLIESFKKGIEAINEPRRIECGAPDLIVTAYPRTIGYIECKDVHKNLDEAEKTEQLNRYLNSLPNLILTNYLEFCWFVDGNLKVTARIGTAERNGKIRSDPAGIQSVHELLSDFLSHRVPSVGTPKELAQRMAKMAQMIRDSIIKTFETEKESGALHNQFKAFEKTLIPGLKPESFADMYAQTIAYGLFAARTNHKNSRPFTRQSAWEDLPKTNPFLRKTFNHIAGPDLDDRITWIVDDLAQLLADANMSEVLKDFGKAMQQEDPVVYFYEDFLKEYDPKMKEARGVYYTPQPVVSYIARSVDHILKTKFACSEGLSDPKILILDPATGTGSFLYAIIQLIYENLSTKGQKGMWDGYVAERLLPRLFGFELLMAPYAVAHLKLGLQLQELGYKFQSGQRLGVYLTNTLSEAMKRSEELATAFDQFISEESNAASEIKKEKPIMVVLGNPPYSGISANRSEVEERLEKGASYKVFNLVGGKLMADTKKVKKKGIVKHLTFIGELLMDYYVVDGHWLGERKTWLQDDYVKFIRFGQWRIEKTGQGILAFITNHGYLDNPTFRGMRQSLMKTFDEIYVLDLHGNAKKKEVCPDGSKDENVFDIQQGVAIGIFVKNPSTQSSPARNEKVKKVPSPQRGEGQGEEGCKIFHSDLWGLREAKYKVLSEKEISNTKWKELKPNSPFYFFVPREEKLRAEYEKGWKVTDIFLVNSTGVVTARDHFVIDFDRTQIEERIKEFMDETIDDATIKEKFGLSENYAWRVSEARKQLIAVKEWRRYFSKILYRPFDIREIYLHPSVVWRTRDKVMRHMLAGENLGLLAKRQNKREPFSYIFCSRKIVEGCVFESAYANNSLYPLYLYPDEESKQGDFLEEKKPNINPKFLEAIKRKTRHSANARRNLPVYLRHTSFSHISQAVRRVFEK